MTALLVLAEPLDAPFRCERFACTLSIRRCLERQAERSRWDRPVHAPCGSGTCEQGNEHARLHGAVPRHTTKRTFATAALPAAAARPSPRPEEPTMKKPPETPKKSPGRAMTDRTCQCGCGRSLRVNNTSGFSGYCNKAKYAEGARYPRAGKTEAKALATRAQERAPARPVPARGRDGWEQIVALEVEELLELRGRLDAEVRRRLEVAEAQVDRLRSAVARAAASAEERAA